MRVPVLSPQARARVLAEQRRALFLGDPSTDCAAKGGLINAKGICCTQGYDQNGICFVKLPSGELTADPVKVNAALAAGYVPSAADPFVLVLASSGGAPGPGTTPATGMPCGNGGTTGHDGVCCPFGAAISGGCFTLLPDGTTTPDPVVVAQAIAAGAVVSPTNPYQLLKGPDKPANTTVVVQPKASVLPWVLLAAAAAGAVYYVSTTSRPPAHASYPHGVPG